MNQVACVACKCQGGHFQKEDWVPCSLCEGGGLVPPEKNEAYLKAQAVKAATETCASCHAEGGEFIKAAWVPCGLCEGAGLVTPEQNSLFLDTRMRAAKKPQPPTPSRRPGRPKRTEEQEPLSPEERASRVRQLLESMKRGGRQKTSRV